jgi:hypothetical protein
MFGSVKVYSGFHKYVPMESFTFTVCNRTENDFVWIGKLSAACA